MQTPKPCVAASSIKSQRGRCEKIARDSGSLRQQKQIADKEDSKQQDLSANLSSSSAKWFVAVGVRYALERGIAPLHWTSLSSSNKKATCLCIQK
jgi:hypothetical protein